jgi:hypothetical protein
VQDFGTLVRRPVFPVLFVFPVLGMAKSAVAVAQRRSRRMGSMVVGRFLHRKRHVSVWSLL